MDSKAPDLGMRAETLDLSPEKARDVARTDRDGVYLIPYSITTLFLFGID